MATRTPKFVKDVGAKNTREYVQLSYPDAKAVCLRPSNRWSRHSEALWEVHATDPETGLRVRLIKTNVYHGSRNASQAWAEAAAEIYSAPRRWAPDNADAERDAEYYWAEIKLQLNYIGVNADADMEAARPNDKRDIAVKDYSYGDKREYTKRAAESLAYLFGTLGQDARQAAALRIAARLGAK